jgi:hypothetical protein
MEHFERSSENASSATKLTLCVVDSLFKRVKGKKQVTGEEIRSILDQLSPEQRSQVLETGNLPEGVNISINDEAPRAMSQKERILFQTHLAYKLRKK